VADIRVAIFRMFSDGTCTRNTKFFVNRVLESTGGQDRYDGGPRVMAWNYLRSLNASTRLGELRRTVRLSCTIAIRAVIFIARRPADKIRR